MNSRTVKFLIMQSDFTVHILSSNTSIIISTDSICGLRNRKEDKNPNLKILRFLRDSQLRFPGHPVRILVAILKTYASICQE
jgi:hypothetical protein